MEKDFAVKNDFAIIWFRNDLRLADNRALIEACKYKNVLPIYIFDENLPESEKMGSASKVWLHYALKSLNDSLGGNLSFYSGNSLDVLKRLVCKYEVSGIFWNRLYDSSSISRDSEIKAYFKGGMLDRDVEVESFNSSLLWEPWTVKKADGTPYKVFTPYYRRGCLNAEEPHEVYPVPSFKNWKKDSDSIDLEELDLLPSESSFVSSSVHFSVPSSTFWHKKIKEEWNISEKGGLEKLEFFIENSLQNYKDGRNYPSKSFTSKLSPYLHFGQISPNQVWQSLKFLDEKFHDENMDCFCSELGWREFSYSLLFYNKDLQHKNIRESFDNFEWLENKSHLLAWQKGQTGIPIIDAGMRELWQTGFMHNRIRMLVGSFLVKNLRLHWHHGERWFWDCLVDADLASNSASWQWIAGCGADAAPYFRIFNPVTQSEKFDPDGSYIRKYVPELANLANKFLFKPWTAPEKVLKEAGVELGKNYPYPLVDLKVSRQEALDAFKQI